jgi:putative transposase
LAPSESSSTIAAASLILVCLDPTVEQTVVLARHVGAARFAYNQCLRLHLDAREHHSTLIRRGADADAVDQARDAVPWSRFSLINAYNRWQVSEDAGRRFLVAAQGVRPALRD